MRVKIVLDHVLCTLLDALLVQRGCTAFVRKIKIVEIICVSFVYFWQKSVLLQQEICT